MANTSTSLAALTTVFTPPPFCTDRYAVFIGTPSPIGDPSTGIPSSGWIDPSFSSCAPEQYTSTYPTFSPGVCPSGMSMIAFNSNVGARNRTTWAGRCCQHGFTTMDVDPQYLCTSSVTTPKAFLIDPNISTTDIYTTLSNLWIQHDQLTVVWEKSDLPILPKDVAAQYASIMGMSAVTASQTSGNSSNTSVKQSAGASVTPLPMRTAHIQPNNLGAGRPGSVVESQPGHITPVSTQATGVQTSHPRMISNASNEASPYLWVWLSLALAAALAA